MGGRSAKQESRETTRWIKHKFSTFTAHRNGLVPSLSEGECKVLSEEETPEQPGSQQVLLSFAMHDQIGEVSLLRARGPLGQAGEDGKGVLSEEEKVEELKSQREERGLNSIEDKKDKGG